MKKKVVAVMSDIHGYQYEHICLINKIKEKHEIIQYIYLGDLIDRGPWVKWVLRFARSLMESNVSVIFLRGNHENGLMAWLNTNNNTILKDWLKNGGKETMKSLTGSKYAPYALQDAIEEYMPVFDSMKYYHVQCIGDKTFVFSHSGGGSGTLDKILDGKKLTHDDLEDLMYSRQRYLHGGVGRNNTFYVYGHTPVHYASDRDGMEPLIMWDANGTSADIDIDTGCCCSKALSALVIDAETGQFETASFPFTVQPEEGEPNYYEYMKMVEA
jgi:hypothetical protein